MENTSPKLFATDTDFLAAERELAKVRAQREALSPQINTLADEKRLDKPLTDRLWALYDQIAKSPPVSLTSAAVKLRLLTDPDIGIEQNEGENDVASLRQVFELVERVASDDAILSLFRQWIEVQRAESDAEGTVIPGIEHAIFDTPAQGAVGFAVKVYLAVFYEGRPGRGGDLAALPALDPESDGNPEYRLDTHCTLSMMRDAARFVPEITALAEPLIGRAQS
jgi:hypothetical protein